ncbi:glycosyl transferase group 1 [Thermoanaerobacterium thermosaccharolyticum DSM 571]|uniref:Glycosyl transferase group 1 n=1 Tax=Thermoanaerobacterium thermosaccharolyticum (strain ATCC 7956 / DSM 571 / NCIMB 9385 / NCA 3814 / NCTC 13789 / WDCM 00135 / 2032) TaxID=580327 RepID=D9TMG1_THETC|nr:glycosyltransferase family 4 protein [Thermoanaerobacterium thermosaccharolyticum]ADL68449.1 glycosyl transferase group 1 [Thermoanaerobacterium thermosaccharolyticum DSM 571]
MSKRVVFLRSNPVAPDPRVEKEAKSLFKHGYDVNIVGWDRTGQLNNEKLPYANITRLNIPAQFGSGIRNFPYLVKWNIYLLIWLFKNHNTYDYIHACDFDTIIPTIITKYLFKKKVVYDIFDFYSDMLRKVPSAIKKLIKKVDFFCINRVDAVIIADECRKKQIKGSNPKRLIVIYNTPEDINNYDNCFEYKEYGAQLRIAYVGLLQIERGLIEMIKVVQRHPNWMLYLAGFGGDENEILSHCSNFSNIKFYGRVNYDIALKINNSSDVMFATYDPSIPNHRFSSANKLFEAMMLGKPIIVAKNTGMDELVEKYRLGEIVEYGDMYDLENALKNFSQMNLYDRDSFSIRVKEIYNKYFSWSMMEGKLISLYEEI